MMSVIKKLASSAVLPRNTFEVYTKDSKPNASRKLFATIIMLATCGWQLSAVADLTGREQAKRIHDRLTGVPPTAQMLTAMETAIANAPSTQQGAVAAALLAIDGDTGLAPSPNFYNVTVKNWASPWTNQSDDVFAPLNDYSALVIGLVKDERDFRDLLGGTVMYVADAALGMPAYSMTNNNHYEQLEVSGANLGTALVAQPQVAVTDLPDAAVAGIFSTRAAGEAFYIDGTNRAMLRFTLRNHLCNDMEQLKDAQAPAHRIRQDVSRSPGGDSRLFLTACLGCHSGMDPLAQAFAYYEYQYDGDAQNPQNGRIVYTPNQVQPKYHINSGNFKEGYVTPDDSWVNHWRQGRNVDIVGWKSDLPSGEIYTKGNGARSMGAELANTQAFAYCQVKKAFESVCLREPSAADGSEMTRIADAFQTDYNMKNVFAELAASCAISSNF